MNKKNLASLLAASLMLAGATAFADDAAPAPAATPSVSTVLTPSLVNQYMFRGVRLGGLSFQPSVEVDSGNFAAGIWANKPLADSVSGQSNPEIDPYASYTIAYNDNLSVVPGITVYTYTNANTSFGFYKATVEPNLALNYTVSGIKLTPKIYYDLVMHGTTYEVTAAYPIIIEGGPELDFSVTGGTYIIADSVNKASPAVKNWGDYYSIGISAPIEITKTSKLIFGLSYVKGSGNFYKQGDTGQYLNTGAAGRGVASLSYTITF